jgi:hypothetical protein
MLRVDFRVSNRISVSVSVSASVGVGVGVIVKVGVGIKCSGISTYRRAAQSRSHSAPQKYRPRYLARPGRDHEASLYTRPDQASPDQARSDRAQARCNQAPNFVSCRS